MKTAQQSNLDNDAFVGRTEELQILSGVFSKVVEDRESRVVAIAGSSGTGKSALVNTFVSTNHVEEKAVFCVTKCEKNRSNEPFAVLKDILDDVAETIPKMEASKRQGLVDDMRLAVGSESHVLISMVPALSGVLGRSSTKRQPPFDATSAIDVNATKESLNYLFRAFFRAICSHSTLVVFCDDLQWVDIASLEILGWLATYTKLPSLLLIVTYRHDETGTNPLIFRRLNEIEEKKAKAMIRIQLRPLSNTEVNDLLSRLLNQEGARMAELADVVFLKTNGNVLFVLEYLEVLKLRNLLFFSATALQWRCKDLEDLKRDTTIADNVVDLIMSKLQLLPNRLQGCLRIASCLSSTISASILRQLISSLLLQDETAVEAQLGEACDKGFLSKAAHHGVPTYKFTHDRVKQAAYSLVEGGQEKEKLHYDIGMHLLAMRDEMEKSRLRQWISFIVTEQLHLGQSCISGDIGFITLARLNLEAGKKALDLAAFVAASQYFRRGLQVMKNVNQPWENHYKLYLSLHRLLENLCWCIGEPTESERLAKETILHARDELEKSRSRLTLAEALGSQDRHKEAIDVEIKELIRLKIFPRSFRTITGIASLVSIRKKLKSMSADAILNLPKCTDEKISIAHALLGILGKHAVYAGNDVAQMLGACLMTKLVLKHGMNSMAIICFALMGIFVGVVFGDAQEACRLGQISRSLMERWGVKDTMGLMVYWGYLHPWINPLNESMDMLLENYNEAMQRGQVEIAFISFGIYCAQALRAGLSLDPLIEDMKSFIETVNEYAFDALRTPIQLEAQSLLNLVGDCDDPKVFTGSIMDEAEFLKSNKENLSFCRFHLNKAHVLFHYGYLEEADQSLQEALRVGKTAVCFHEVLLKMYFSALIPLSLAAETGGASKYKRRARRAIGAIRRAITKEGRGINMAHILQMLDASFLGLSYHHRHPNSSTDTMGTLSVQQAFDKAIKMSTRAGFRQDAAVANLLAGQFFLRIGETFEASDYLSRAIQLYEDWGAHGVVRQLKLKYSEETKDTNVAKLHSTDHRGRKRHSKKKYSLQEQQSIRDFLTTKDVSNRAL